MMVRPRTSQDPRALRFGPGVVLVTSLALALSGLAAGPARAQDAPSPLGFTEALALARTGPDVALAQLGLAQSQAALGATSSTASGTLQGGYSERWTDAPGYASHRSGLAPFTLNATLNVIPYGPAYDARATAARSVKSAQLVLQDAVAEATVQAAQAYLQALRASQRVELERTAVVQAQAASAHARSLRATGDATDDDVATAQVALTQATTTLAGDRLILQGALASLADVVGRPVTAVAGEPPASRDPPGNDLASVERRSDVRQATLALAESRQGYTAAVLQALPTASASASLQGGDGSTTWNAGLSFDTGRFQPSLQAAVTPGGSTLSTTTALDGTSFALGVSLSIPIDTGLAPALESARLSVAAAQQKLDRTRQQAKLAVAAARRTLQTGALALDLAASQRDLSASQAAQAAQRLDLGLIARPTLDTADLAAGQARLAWLTALDTVLLDRMALAQALALDPTEVF